MTRAVKPLIDLGFVHETEEQLEGPGRPPRPLVGMSGAHRFVGVKLTGDDVYAVATDVLADVVAESRHPLTGHEPTVVADVVAAVVRELVPGDSLFSVGVALGGSVSEARTVDRAPFLDWRGVPLAELIEEKLSVPVFIDNDLAALAAGEHWFGVARGVPNFAVVTVGMGIGLAIVREGTVVRTHDIGLGLAGHIPLDPSGPRCMLGHRGCSTALLTISSIEAQASVALNRKVSFSEVIELSRQGDNACREIVVAAATALGRLLALVANLAAIDVVVLGGDGLPILDGHEIAMRRSLGEGRDPEATTLDIRVDRSGFERWARGAAADAIQWSLPRLLADTSS